MSDEDSPFTNGSSNGDEYARDGNGRFKPGTRGGPGNPRAAYARQLSDRNMEAAFKTCDPARLLKAWDAMLAKAETGDVAAMKLILEFFDGPPGQRSASEKMAELEALVERITKNER